MISQRFSYVILVLFHLSCVTSYQSFLLSCTVCFDVHLHCCTHSCFSLASVLRLAFVFFTLSYLVSAQIHHGCLIGEELSAPETSHIRGLLNRIPWFCVKTEKGRTLTKCLLGSEKSEHKAVIESKVVCVSVNFVLNRCYILMMFLMNFAHL